MIRPIQRRFGLVAAALLLLCLSGAVRVHGDVFELANGGRIEGRLIDDGAGKGDYLIETATGRVSLARSQVARVDATSTAENEYDARARTAPDTVDAHWQLYEWCRSKKLREQSQKHLTRILELDPDHAEARSLLGFRKQGNQWVTREEIMAARGMVKHEGQYYTRQHVELLERQKASKESHVDWRRDLERMRNWLTGRYEDRAQQARKEIQAVRDPRAADAVVALLRKENEPALKRLWLEVASRLDAPSAIQALVDLSLNDPNEEIRHQSLEYLIASGRPGIAAPYLEALRSSDNVMINRAATALGQIGDPAAIPSLMDVLVTVHKVKVSDNSGQMAVSMSRGNTSFGMGGGPKIVNREVRNPDVLTALVNLARITGFEYDQEAWRNWLAEQAKQHPIDMRRDQ
jgi:hypothetical protein